MEMATSTTWHVVLDFVGIDLEDDAVLEALEPTPEIDVIWSSTEGIVTADATVVSATPGAAVAAVQQVASSAVPSSEFVRLVDPLVAISDIAEEAGVSRQAVRNWALGTRQTGFPRPLFTVGDGIRVWRLADIDRWLSESLSLGSGRNYLSAVFVADYNASGRVGGAQPPGSKDSDTEKSTNREAGDSLVWHAGFTRTEIQKVTSDSPPTQRSAAKRTADRVR